LYILTAKIANKILNKRTERKTRMYFEKISLNSEEEREPGMQLGCSEYLNVQLLWTRMKNCVVASQTDRRHLAV
jgi:hypothetical protein